MKARYFFLLFFATVTGVATGQDQTAATVTNAPPRTPFGFSLPSSFGTLTYSLTGSESVSSGFDTSGTGYSTALSGNLAYLSNSAYHPFSLVYSGGYIFSTYSGSGAPGDLSSSFYQSLAASQMYRTKKWVFLASDAVSYLPESPTTGLSGIAGVGDLGVTPVQNGIEPNQTVLTDYGKTIANGLNGSASWQVAPRFTLQGSGSWQTLRFISGEGYDTNTYTATVGPSYHIDARNSVAGDVYYSRSTYSGYDSVIEVYGATVNYSHSFSRRLNASVGAGPQFTHGSGPIPIPSTTGISADVSVGYSGERTSMHLSYDRGTNAGSGIYLGASSDTVSFGANRPLNRIWQASAQASYSRSQALATIAGQAYSTATIIGGFQLSRRLGRSFSGYLSYTAATQSESNAAFSGSAFSQNAFSGLNNVVGVGVTFSPAALHSAGR